MIHVRVQVKLVEEMFSPSVLEIAMGKLPNEMTEAWGEKIIREREEMSLVNWKDIITYQMDRITFSNYCSPFLAIYATR